MEEAGQRMKKPSRPVVGLVLNLLIVALEVVGLLLSIADHGWGLFQFYTQDSNLIALLACGLMAAQQISCLCGKRESAARWVWVLKYTSVCMLAVTFLVVIFVLAPIDGAGLRGYSVMLFGGSMLYHHFLCPILAFISFLFFDGETRVTRRDTFLALIPTVLYALIAVLLNILRVMQGPYPFLMVYSQPVYASALWFIAIIGGAYLISLLIRAANGRRVAHMAQRACDN